MLRPAATPRFSRLLQSLYGQLALEPPRARRTLIALLLFMPGGVGVIVFYLLLQRLRGEGRVARRARRALVEPPGETRAKGKSRTAGGGADRRNPDSRSEVAAGVRREDA